MANAFNSSLRGDVGISCIVGFQQHRLSGRYKSLIPLTSSTIYHIFMTPPWEAFVTNAE